MTTDSARVKTAIPAVRRAYGYMVLDFTAALYRTNGIRTATAVFSLLALIWVIIEWPLERMARP